MAAPLDGGAGCLRRAGVGAHRGVDAREHTCVGHDHLAADRFFGRRAEDFDAAPVTQAERRGQTDAGADAGDGDQIVTAAVANAGQGVVFGEVGDTRGAVPPVAVNAVGSPATPRSTAETTRGEEVGASGARLHFFQGGLGVIVDEP